MEHVVFYPSADGTPAFRRVPSLEDAVNFVEHLRNSAGTTEFSVHALAEVPLTFRAYYHVEIPGEPQAAPAATAADVAPAPEPAAALAAPSTPFAAAPPVAVPVPAVPVAETLVAEVAAVGQAAVDEPADVPLGDSQDVVPLPNGRRSMGFFARP